MCEAVPFFSFISGALPWFARGMRGLWKKWFKKYPVAIPNSQGPFESNNLPEIIDIQKLKSDPPPAMKLYYSEKTAIINLPKSVKNTAIKVAKKILMY